MAARKYGSESLNKPTHDSDGHEIRPDGTVVLTDAEVEQRIREKIELQARLARERGTKTAQPTIVRERVKPVDPAEAAALDAELAQARADLHALAEAEKEAKRQEQKILEQADRERKDRRLALQQRADEIAARVAEVEARARAAKLGELSADHATAEERNRARAEAGVEAARAEMERIFRPILNEIEATMQEGNDFMKAYGDSLRLLAAQTFSTSDASFPIAVRQKLSADCYRPAERLLEYINNVLSCGSAGGDPRWDVVLRSSIAEGKLISPEGLTLTKQYAGAVNRDHVRSWERTLAQITARLETLTAQGKASAQAPPSIRIVLDDRQRQEAARDARLGKRDAARPTQAQLGSVFTTPNN